MNRKTAFYSFLLFFLLSVTLFASPGDVQVGVLLPPEGSGDIAEIISGVMTDTLSLTLQLLGGYEVHILTDGDVQNDGSLKRFDTLIRSEVLTDPQLVVKFLVSDGNTGEQIYLFEKEVSSILKIFEIVDDAIIEMLGTLSGRDIGFGQLILDCDKSVHTYYVEVDGVLFGENIREINRLLNGAHTITVYQKRLTGKYVVYREKVFVEEGRTSVMSFTFPEVIKAESDSLLQLELPYFLSYPFWTDEQLELYKQQTQAALQHDMSPELKEKIENRLKDLNKPSSPYTPERNPVPEPPDRIFYFNIQGLGQGYFSLGATAFLLKNHMSISALVGMGGGFQSRELSLFLTGKVNWHIFDYIISPHIGLFGGGGYYLRILDSYEGRNNSSGVLGINLGFTVKTRRFIVYMDNVFGFDIKNQPDLGRDIYFIYMPALGICF